MHGAGHQEGQAGPPGHKLGAVHRQNFFREASVLLLKRCLD